MSREIPTGIDLGTSNSAMAWVEDGGRSAMIPNAEGELITPSVVFFGDSEVVVGKNARSAVTAHPEMVAQWVKRDMGAAFYAHPIRGRFLPPEVIQACILGKLKADIVRAVGPETRTVITVPAYFDELRRKATADAGEMAGLRVLDIVNEPTAAALAFGEAIGYLSPSGTPQQEMTVMVYDLGGGTFDVTILRLASGRIQTLATDGDVQLGGHDWDQRLVDYAAEAFLNSHQRDPREDPATLNRLYQDAMEAKHTLTARSRASIQINYSGRASEVQILREQFEEMTADLIERTSYTSRQLLTVAGLHWSDIQRVLLVGGSTRMPMVACMLRKLAEIEPDRIVNPDEAVARGAALYASHLLARQEGLRRPTFQVTNVNAHSLGVEGIDTDTLRKKNVILIPRNSALPVKHSERFATKSEGQRSIVIRVLEGESSLPSECISIGRTVVRDLPAGLPKAWPIEITFEYGTNGRLTVLALVPGTQHRAVLELERDVGLSGGGIARWKVVVSAAAGFGTFESVTPEGPKVPAAAGESGSGGNVGWAMTDAGASAASSATPPSGLVSVPLAVPMGGAPLAVPPSLEKAAPPAILAVPPVKPAATPAAPVATPVTPSTPQPLPTIPIPVPRTWTKEADDRSAMAAIELADAAAPARRARREPLMPLWASRLIGHVVAGGLGLAVAYWMLCRYRPDLFPPHW